MTVYEIGTGYTPIPATISAATEIVVEELTKALMQRNIPVQIVDIAADNRPEHFLPIREVKVPTLFRGTDVHLGLMHKLKRVAYSIGLAGELKRILKQTRETVVFHFHNQYNLFFFLKLVPESLRRRCKIAYTNHSGIWRLPWQEIETVIRKRYFQEAECMKQADILFLLNQETKENAVTHLGIPEDRIVVLSNGVNTDIYHPLPDAEKETAMEKLGFQGRKVILQVGSVCENKGQRRSLTQLCSLLQEDSSVVFAYAGGVVSEEYQRQILAFARENRISDQVRYLGMLPPGGALNELYNAAAATVCASRYEGCSLAVMESLASGTPVLVEEDSPFYAGVGCVKYPGDQLGDVIRENLLCDEESYRQLCNEARNTALQTYGWDSIASEYLKHFCQE